VLQLLSILTTTMEVLPRDGVLLLHLSASSGRGELKGGGAFASTSNLVAADGAAAAAAGAAADPEGASQPDSMSDVSGLSIGALTVSNAGTEAGLNLGPSKALVRLPVGAVRQQGFRSSMLLRVQGGARASCRQQSAAVEMGYAGSCLEARGDSCIRHEVVPRRLRSADALSLQPRHCRRGASAAPGAPTIVYTTVPSGSQHTPCPPWRESRTLLTPT
jgi:hypothetical protein